METATKLKAWMVAHGGRPGKFPVMSFTWQLAIEYMNAIERNEKIWAQTYNNYLRQNKLQFYSLKDSGITNMLGSGVPVSFVKQQADHSSLAMTSIYLGKSPNASEELKHTHIIK